MEDEYIWKERKVTKEGGGRGLRNREANDSNNEGSEYNSEQEAFNYLNIHSHGIVTLMSKHPGWVCAPLVMMSPYQKKTKNEKKKTTNPTGELIPDWKDSLIAKGYLSMMLHWLSVKHMSAHVLKVEHLLVAGNKDALRFEAGSVSPAC